jgi:acyl-coenzyme A synthetase/AMP-(fatty) acid ligase
MTKQEFLEKLSWSRSEIVDQDGNVHKASQLFDRAIKAKHNSIKLFTSDRAEDLYVEILAAAMGEGTLVRGPVMPDKLPEGRWHWISHTSGSTGKPKWVGHTFETLMQPAMGFAQAHNVTDKDTFFNLMPLISENTTFGMMASIINGGRVVINKFNPFTTTKAFVDCRPTLTTLAPGPYSVLRRGKDWVGAEFPGLRVSISGSNFVYPGYFEDMASKGATAYNGFGCTEVPGNCTAYQHPDYLGKEWYSGCEYKIEEGLLLLRWQDMEWWNTGDLAEFDDVHGVKIVGRRDNQFKYLDNKIQPEPMETLVKHQFKLNEAMVKLEGDDLVMYYEGSADTNEMRKLLEQHFLIVPRKIQAVEQLPRNPLGKLVRK